MANYRIRIGSQTFSADSERPLLDAIPGEQVVKGCLKGVCRVCRCRLVSGCVMENGREVASRAEFLPCVSRAEADVEITPAISSFQHAKVKSKTRLGAQIMEIELEVRRVFYNAKSVVTLKHPELDAVRSYSVVSLGPRRYDSLTLHVKLRPGGLFSTLFETLAVGSVLDYLLVNPALPHYDAAPSGINVVSGGSGMGAALSRALELVANYRIPQVAVYAVNRAELSDYHRGCIETFRRHAACDVNVSNITFKDWTSARFNIHERLAQDALTVGVGSDVIIGRLETLALCELESFG